MTQAFNLSQLGNTINSSGQVSLTSGITGTLPIANGGTNLTSAGTSGFVVTSTGSAFVMAALPATGVASLNGQTGTIDNTTQYAIGSYVMGRGQNDTNYNNSTLAGSSLYAAAGGSYYQTAGEAVGWTNSDGSSPSFYGNPQVLVNTGSWRCVSIAMGGYYSTGAYGKGFGGLWVRYA